MAKPTRNEMLEKRFLEAFPGLPSKVILLPNPKKKSAVKFDINIEDREGRVIEKLESNDITRAPGTRFTLMAIPSAKLGGFLDTGLTDYVVNPYKEYTSFKSPEWERILKGQDMVLRQHIMEYFWNKPINYYTNEVIVERMPTDDRDRPMRFFQSEASMLDLEDGSNSIDLSTELGMIKYFMALADPMIANSYEEITPETAYYIARVDEENERKTKSAKKVDSAVARLYELSENYPTTLIQLCKVLGINRKVNATTGYEILSYNIKNEKDFVENFIYYYDMWKEESTRPLFEARAFLWDLLEYRVVSERSNKYTWYPPKDETGKQVEPLTWERKEELLDFLSNPKFKREQGEMLEQIKANQRFL